ncbi:50S ribosomal protein L29 [Candidatus Uhrbacteria bacterium]|nr:50S ribosomal protein L29 [Candidatus Uhrbacteria bacterium]
MDAKTLRAKTATVLQKDLEEAQARLRELCFKRSSNQLKNVRALRALKRGIARIKTILTQGVSSDKVTKVT